MSVSRHPNSAVLRAYSLGVVPYDAALAFQRRAHFEVTGDRSHGQLLLCEHPHGITVGRHGSRRHVLAEPEELAARDWAVRWVGRGGGTWLHAPGQLALYAVFPLDALHLDVAGYLDRLLGCASGVSSSLGVADLRVDPSGRLFAGDRLLASAGVAVRDGVTTFGLILNVNPKLDAFRLVDWSGDNLSATSLQREFCGPVRMAAVRQRLLDAFVRRFGFARLSLLHAHPAFNPRTSDDAVAPRAS